MSGESKALLWAGVAVIGAWWIFGSDEEAGLLGQARQLIDAGVDLVTRGQRLTRAPYDTSTGIVPGNPQALADSTTYDLETYALARAISSEEGRANAATKLAVGWAIKNRANASSGSVASLVLKAKDPTHSGYFGTQRNIDPSSTGYGGSDRYCSTANDPYEGDAQIAFAIQTGTLPDPTGGAQYFDRSASDDNPEQVAENRAADGLVLADVAGDVDSGLRFWRPA